MSTFSFLKRGQRIRAPGEQTWGVQADRGPGGPADLQEWAGRRILILSQGEMFIVFYANVYQSTSWRKDSDDDEFDKN